MADWRDGSEFAPVERPFGFAVPRTAPLSVAEPAASPADGQPAQPPAGFTAPAAPPLERLAPRDGVRRDPRQAFDAGSSGLGTSSAAGAGWTPTQPLLVSGDTQAAGVGTAVAAPGASASPAFPAPAAAPPGAVATPAWGAPPPGAQPVATAGAPGAWPQPALPAPAPWASPSLPPSAQYQPPTVPGAANPYVTQPSPARPPRLLPWVMFLALLGGALIPSLSVLLLAAALAAARFGRLGAGGRPVMGTLGVGLVIAVVMGALTALGADPGDRWASFNAVARIECWILMLLVALQMVSGRRR